MPERGPVQIDRLSVTSLYLKIYANDKRISTATGFVVERHSRRFLLTNWHVLAGRHPEKEGLPPLSKTGAIPDEIRVAHHIGDGSIGNWKFVPMRLVKETGERLWIEHPSLHEVDIACIEITRVPEDVRIFPLDMDLAKEELDLWPGDLVSVVGFPLGLRPNEFFGVWKTGHLATDLDYPYKGKAAFLIDATTREGMSGSPVFARRRVNLPAYSIPAPIDQRWSRDGVPPPASPIDVRTKLVTKFLGVYSSRIHDEAEIGTVWRPSLIDELLNRAVA